MSPEQNPPPPYGPPTLPQLPPNPYDDQPQQQPPSSPAGPLPPAPLPTTPTPPPPQVPTSNPYDKPMHRRAPFALLVILLVGMIVALAVWLGYQMLSGPKEKTLLIDNTSYIFTFDSSGKEVTEGGAKYIRGQELQGSTDISVTAKKSPVEGDCTSRGSQAKFNVTIEGQSFPVCQPDNNASVYVTYFQKDKQWHIITLFAQDGKSKPNEAGVKELLSSIKVQ